MKGMDSGQYWEIDGTDTFNRLARQDHSSRGQLDHIWRDEKQLDMLRAKNHVQK